MASWNRLAAIPYPSHHARTPERELLGRTLFFDPRLSGSGWISCASCHNPGFSWSDGLPRAVGHGMQQLGRRTPTILNLAWAPALFWDGRAESLEEQALGPIEAAGEMNMKLDDMVRRLEGIPGYRALFEAAYPQEPLSAETVAKAIATFERGVVSAQAPFDRWVAGDEGAISAAAQSLPLLQREGALHSGWRFTDDGFYDIGMEANDPGRAKVTPRIDQGTRVRSRHSAATSGRAPYVFRTRESGCPVRPSPGHATRRDDRVTPIRRVSAARILFARPRLKIRVRSASLRMNEHDENRRRPWWRQRKKLCRSALSFPL